MKTKALLYNTLNALRHPAIAALLIIGLLAQVFAMQPADASTAAATTTTSIPEVCGRTLESAMLYGYPMFDYRDGDYGEICGETFKMYVDRYISEWRTEAQPSPGWYSLSSIINAKSRVNELRNGSEWGLSMAWLRGVNDSLGNWTGATNCYTTDRVGRFGLLYVEEWTPDGHRAPSQLVIRADIYDGTDDVDAVGFMMDYFTRCAVAA